ncbi:hypothetical protein MtrunA17_Chr1g0171861 [Medicago truncatula]|uniref:Uncharacterized protein n=1 Tax=Medicago truncatula TaxID=3880 RepID=A0A396JRQ4_MEDTR|nr:hypothetical protein MtrunA17_Chr1g0171861 [Medicago truncatula]
MTHEQQVGHLIKPFSLQSMHLFSNDASLYLLNFPFSSSNTLLLPLHFEQGTNLASPHLSHTNPESLIGKPFNRFSNSPDSCSNLISSAFPTCFPLIKTCGNVTILSPSAFCNSFL